MNNESFQRCKASITERTIRKGENMSAIFNISEVGVAEDNEHHARLAVRDENGKLKETFHPYYGQQGFWQITLHDKQRVTFEVEVIGRGEVWRDEL